MATKISKVNAERLKKLGITAKTEEEAKKSSSSVWSGPEFPAWTRRRLTI